MLLKCYVKYNKLVITLCFYAALTTLTYIQDDIACHSKHFTGVSVSLSLDETV